MKAARVVFIDVDTQEQFDLVIEVHPAGVHGPKQRVMIKVLDPDPLISDKPQGVHIQIAQRLVDAIALGSLEHRVAHPGTPNQSPVMDPISAKQFGMEMPKEEPFDQVFVPADKYRYITDPGHGWLEVPKAEIYALDIFHAISNCSYMNDKFVYLEEDMDLQTWIEAKKLKDPGFDFHNSITDVYQEHTFVRNLSHFEVEPLSTL